QVELAALHGVRRLGALDVGDRRIGAAEDRALIRRGKETAVEVVEAARRDEAAVEDDEARQILVLTAETVAEPCPHARPTLYAAAGVQEVIGARVLRELRCHGANEGEIVDALGDVRKQFTDPSPALAALRELPRRRHDLSDIVELRRLHLEDGMR